MDSLTNNDTLKMEENSDTVIVVDSSSTTAPSLTTAGLTFMSASWLTIILLLTFCFYKIFSEKEEKIVGVPEIESEIDEMDR